MQKGYSIQYASCSEKICRDIFLLNVKGFSIDSKYILINSSSKVSRRLKYSFLLTFAIFFFVISTDPLCAYNECKYLLEKYILVTKLSGKKVRKFASRMFLSVYYNDIGWKILARRTCYLLFFVRYRYRYHKLSRINSQQFREIFSFTCTCTLPFRHATRAN